MYQIFQFSCWNQKHIHAWTFYVICGFCCAQRCIFRLITLPLLFSVLSHVQIILYGIWNDFMSHIFRYTIRRYLLSFIITCSYPSTKSKFKGMLLLFFLVSQFWYLDISFNSISQFRIFASSFNIWWFVSVSLSVF